MKLRYRYRRLTLWNKFGFWGAVASLIGIPLTVFIYIITQDTTTPAKDPSMSAMAWFRETPVIRLVWRIYFSDSPEDQTAWCLPLPKEGSIHLVSFVPFDELYQEAYWDERMHLKISASVGSLYPDVELVRNHIAHPFRRYDHLDVALVQPPSFGRYLAVYWECKLNTMGRDLERLCFSVWFDGNHEIWIRAVSKIVLMADDIPIAFYEIDKYDKMTHAFQTRKAINPTLFTCSVNAYTGELEECRH